MSKTRVCICGFGQIGRKFAKAVIERKDMELVAVIDRDPSLVGEHIKPFLSVKSSPVLKVLPDIFSIEDGLADICVVTTSSSGAECAKLIMDILKRKLPVITTCEEFANLSVKYPELAQQLNQSALTIGVGVLGTGINPGFLMDALPVMLSGCTTHIKAVTVERVQDAAKRRMQFQRKIGAGLTQEDFEIRRNNGVLRHVGFEESAKLIARALNLKFDRFEEKIKMVKSSRHISLPGAIEIKRGYASGVDQRFTLYAGKRAVVSLRLRATVGEPENYDRIRIDGSPIIESTIKNGVNGDGGTCAVLLNSVIALKNTRKVGLLTSLDLLPIPSVVDNV